MPVTGNGFRYAGPRLVPFLKKIHHSGTDNTLNNSYGHNALIEILNPLPNDFMLYSVVKNTLDGLLVTTNHNIELEGLLMLPAVLTYGIGASFFSKGTADKIAVE